MSDGRKKETWVRFFHGALQLGMRSDLQYLTDSRTEPYLVQLCIMVYSDLVC